METCSVGTLVLAGVDVVSVVGVLVSVDATSGSVDVEFPASGFAAVPVGLLNILNAMKLIANYSDRKSVV